MKKIELLFLEALKASLNNTTVNWSSADVSPAEINQLYQLANIHQIQPMIFEATFRSEAVQLLGPQFTAFQKHNIIRVVAAQTMKTAEFQELYQHLLNKGLKPCVVKGMICRNLYPNPDARVSSDEDVWIPEEQYSIAHEAMMEFGMVLSEPDKDIYKEYEVPYGKQGSFLYIELHKHLFPPESEAYGDLNLFFKDSQNNLVTEKIDGSAVYTLHPTDHLVYLICHAFKHFLHGGFGIRQVCDIIMYANHYGKDIDWAAVLERCREIRGELFAASMFKIGEKYLNFDPENACYSSEWAEIQVDEAMMLKDLLESGIYGASTMNRKHSSNITLSALVADKRGKKAKASVWGSIFLPRKSLVGRFPYLERFPFLLPVAWVQRIWIYKKESGKKGNGNNASESIQIGSQRVELMRQYGIIK